MEVELSEPTAVTSASTSAADQPSNAGCSSGAGASHHVWCNFSARPVEGCRQCAGLWERYPYDGVAEMAGLVGKHFPGVVVR